MSFFSRFGRRSRPKKAPSPPELLILPPDPAHGFAALPFLLVRDGFRTLRISVRPEENTDGLALVTVKAPSTVHLRHILPAVAGKRAWIESKREMLRQRPPALRGPRWPRWTDGDILYHQGCPCRLRLLPDVRSERSGEDAAPKTVRLPKIRLCEGVLENPENPEGTGEPLLGILEARGRDLRPDTVRKALGKWRKEATLRLGTERLAVLHGRACALLGDNLPLPPLKVRSLKRRWGSCSARGEITLADRLCALPPEFMDYVILHELCHLRRFDHSPEFHALLARLLPGERDCARRLREWTRAHPIEG